MARARAVTFIVSGQQLEAAGTVNSAAIDCSVFQEMTGILSVTVAAGTDPTLDVKFQVSIDGTIWADLVAFTRATAATTERKALTNFGKWLRAVSAVGSSDTDGDFSFSLVATGKMNP